MNKCISIFIILLWANYTLLSMTPEDAQKIGNQIWQNEAGGREDLLVFWNPHESFPSLGIGHNIWYPEGFSTTYEEQFPRLCDYLKKNGVKLPIWLKKSYQKGAPWKSREQFIKDETKVQQLQTLLASTVSLQTQFMIDRLDAQYPLIIQAAPEKKKKHIERCFQLMKSTLVGTYALIDYLNFKGSGIQQIESKTAQGWGLLQVLLDMPQDIKSDTVLSAFSVSCAQVLLTRIKNASPAYNLNRFLAGWMKRVSTYSNVHLF